MYRPPPRYMSKPVSTGEVRCGTGERTEHILDPGPQVDCLLVRRAEARAVVVWAEVDVRARDALDALDVRMHDRAAEEVQVEVVLIVACEEGRGSATTRSEAKAERVRARYRTDQGELRREERKKIDNDGRMVGKTHRMAARSPRLPRPAQDR